MPKQMTFDGMRRKIGEWLQQPDGKRLWDLLVCLRGPDYPSETPKMSSAEKDIAYRGRRDRKFKTVEIIRHKAFFGVCGGEARHHNDEKVMLPPTSEWDHFDKHVSRAADVLGLKVEIEKKDDSGVEVVAASAAATAWKKIKVVGEQQAQPPPSKFFVYIDQSKGEYVVSNSPFPDGGGYWISVNWSSSIPPIEGMKAKQWVGCNGKTYHAEWVDSKFKVLEGPQPGDISSIYHYKYPTSKAVIDHIDEKVSNDPKSEG